jgi:hypothetical protein
MLIRDPVLQELNRRAVAERGVAATPVVEHFDVIEQIGDCFGILNIFSPSSQLSLYLTSWKTKFRGKLREPHDFAGLWDVAQLGNPVQQPQFVLDDAYVKMFHGRVTFPFVGFR